MVLENKNKIEKTEQNKKRELERERLKKISTDKKGGEKSKGWNYWRGYGPVAEAEKEGICRVCKEGVTGPSAALALEGGWFSD